MATQSLFDSMRARLEAQAGILPPPPATRPSVQELERSEWDDRFEKLMRNRLIMGALRYGRLGDRRKPQYNRPASIRRRLLLYEQTGNLEHLVDIANEALVEFVESRHPQRHWASGDGAYHTTH